MKIDIDVKVIDIKVPLSQESLPKTTWHTTLTLQNYSLEKKLLQELADEMFIIISITVRSKISPFIKFIWDDQHQLEFATINVQKPTAAYHLRSYKTGIEFLNGSFFLAW